MGFNNELFINELNYNSGIIFKFKNGNGLKFLKEYGIPIWDIVSYPPTSPITILSNYSTISNSNINTLSQLLITMSLTLPDTWYSSNKINVQTSIPIKTDMSTPEMLTWSYTYKKNDSNDTVFPNTTETYSYGPATNLVIQATTLDTFLTGDVFTLKIYGKSQTNSFIISNSPFVIGSIFPTA